VIATYSIAEEYIKHPDDVIYYTAPVFFWTNVELSLAIVCACLPTLRPIWFHFHPRPVNTHLGSGYGSSKLTGTRASSFGVKYGGSRKPYQELEEVELTQYEGMALQLSDPPSMTNERVILKAVAIHQTLA
jgi:hypothetical protein